MSLDKIRQEIESTDAKIIELLEKRIKLAIATREFKTQAEDLDREQKVANYLENLANKNHLSVEYIQSLYKLIISESKRHQK